MDTPENIYQKIKIKKTSDSSVTVEGELTTDFFAQCYKDTVERLRQDFEAPGFRKGHVPEQVFLGRVNQGHILEEAAEVALQRSYPKIIADHELKPLGMPQITITKLALMNPLGFKAEILVRPEIKLPDYKKIAKNSFSGELPIEIKEDEVETFIKQILEMETKIRKRDQSTAQNEVAVELTDELVKKLGPFENVEDFKKKIREDMLAQKKIEAARERREVFAKELIETSSLVLPGQIVDEETETSLKRILEDLKKANLTLEEYTKKLDKTEEQFKIEKREQIENQLKLRFLLEDIASKEKLNTPEEEVDMEVSRLRKVHPEADPKQLRSYAELLLQNEAVLKFLENLVNTT
jgi:trigger factor